MRRIACGLLATFAVSSATYAADELVPAPKGAPLLLEVDADGVQIYACEAMDQSFAWVFKAPEAKSHEGAGVPANAAFIRRLDTKGGAAPAAGCDAARKGEQARIRYYALHQFFGVAK